MLLIIADDYGTDSQSLYNTTAGATAPTPDINALAASGVRFTNAYACSGLLAHPRHDDHRSSSVSAPASARWSPLAAGNSLTAAELTLPEVISQNSALGIQSACFGKWHLSAGTPAATAQRA